MTLRDLAAEAVATLDAHRTRSLLCALGVLAGVATVTTGLAIGEGARRAALEEIAGLGLDNVIVRSAPGHAAVAGDRAEGPPAAPPASVLTTTDLARLRAGVAGVDEGAATRMTTAEIVGATARAEAPLVGVTPGWRRVAGREIGHGRWLTADDLRARRRVVVLGATLARSMFGGTDPLGQLLRAGSDWYRVVGVLAGDAESRARRSPLVRIDPQTAAFVPLPAMDRRLGAGDDLDRVDEIVLRVVHADRVVASAVAATAILERRHPKDPDGRAAWAVVVPRDLLRARLRAQRTFDVILLALGALTLLVSGVGIMNVMLSSVAERAPEIGVRRALGARTRDIVRQVALEAAIVYAAGAAAGLPTGMFLAGLVAIAAAWPVAVSGSGALLALGLAALTSFAFTVPPVRRAARIDPIAAIHSVTR